ncbi:hypothetical protein BG006_005938 [Podila minutissima]|uniref:alkaline phosphatase n=1 Tax=Podila minutissima TaxID=64525 RepID=A0A9P5VM07_9FUNG|nr:hypothetical protein BG006_005938 [Podila minutissima]
MAGREVTAPLLANEDPRDSFDEDERALLQQEETKQIRRERRRMVLCLGLALVLTSSAVAITFFFAKRSLGRSRNVIMMVSAGFGPASQAYGRSFWQYRENLPIDRLTELDKMLVGTSRTRSSDSLITDAAAGATAFSCALKSYNTAIGVDEAAVPCGTILEAAHALGMLTGVVVTSRITHATPAAFSAHVAHRDMEETIAEHQVGDYILGRQIDLMLGGGRCFFLPNTTSGGCRTDGRNLIKESENFGWKHVMLNKKEFEEKSMPYLPLPALGLFHPDHMNYEIDRDKTLKSEEPSLSQMALAALNSLKNNAGNNQGFFLMIESSRIDMGAHNNDPVAHVHEILEYYKTVNVVRTFLRNNPDTVVISTSDHETGGFTLGSQEDLHTYPEYLWRPEVIVRANRSTEVLTRDLFAYQGKDRRSFVKTSILEQGLGISDPTEDELSFLSSTNEDGTPAPLPKDILAFLGHAISRRANLGWTTMGHTGVDVNLYAAGERIEGLRGNHENTYIGEFMSEYLKVDLDVITRKLAQPTDKRWFKSKDDMVSMLFEGAAPSRHEVSGVCLDSVASALIAEQTGGKRIELCAGLLEGGITPSAGLISTVKAKTSLPVMVMIRPRGGDFCYDDDEFEAMLADIKICHSLKVEGVVFGVLLPDASVDKARTKMAFDMVKDPLQALEDIIGIGGIQRILTSGCERSAYEGLDMLVQLVKRAQDRVIILPGAGITDRNVEKIVAAMGAKEVHVGAGGSKESKMLYRNPYCSMGYAISAPEYALKVTSESKLGGMIQKF